MSDAETGLSDFSAKYWEGLTLFLHEGRIEIDSNAAERTIRPIALNRKNALFAGCPSSEFFG